MGNSFDRLAGGSRKLPNPEATGRSPYQIRLVNPQPGFAVNRRTLSQVLPSQRDRKLPPVPVLGVAAPRTTPLPNPTAARPTQAHPSLPTQRPSADRPGVRLPDTQRLNTPFLLPPSVRQVMQPSALEPGVPPHNPNWLEHIPTEQTFLRISEL